MSLTFLIYLASLFNGLAYAVLFFIVVAIVHISVCAFKILETDRYDNDYEENLTKNRSKVKMDIILIVVLSVLCATIPSEKSIWLMIGSSAIGKTGIPEKIVDVINLKLDEILKKEKSDGKAKRN